MLTIREIWRYPIKSVGGERVSMETVTELGIAGDRGWGIFDVESATVLTARRAPELLFATASLTGDGVEIALPDGSSVNSDNDCDTLLSAWLGRPVELRAAGSVGGTYEVPLDFEADEDWVSWQGPGGAWHDSARTRVSLVSRHTLGAWDQRRFRANVILDGSGEDALVGHTISVGDQVRLDVTKQIDRCVIVTRPQPGLDRDLDVLRSINSERASRLAIAALVNTGGTIEEGNELVAIS